MFWRKTPKSQTKTSVETTLTDDELIELGRVAYVEKRKSLISVLCRDGFFNDWILANCKMSNEQLETEVRNMYSGMDRHA